MEPELKKFLLERGISSESVAVMADEKIDIDAILNMKEEDFIAYVPKLGDRIAIQQFCAKSGISKDGQFASTDEFVRALKQKRLGQFNTKKSSKSQKLVGNKNAKKQERKFEIGWKILEGKSFRQVRLRKGGGTRYLKGPVDMTVEDIIKEASPLFSLTNKLQENANLRILDFNDKILDKKTTLEQLYQKYKVKTLRIYICVFPSKHEDQCENGNTSTSSNADNRELPTETSLDTESYDTLPDLDLDLSTETARSVSIPVDNVLPSILPDTVPAHPKASTPKHSLGADCQLEASTSIGTLEKEQPPLNHVLSDVELDDDLIQHALMQSNIDFNSDDSVQFGGIDEGGDSLSQNATLPLSAAPVKLKLHRGHVFKELNDAIRNDTLKVSTKYIEIQMVLPNGINETGQDTGGILRDALSEYWDTFYKKATTGSSVKVPILRHDMINDWEIVAKVIVIGYNCIKYFPIQIAEPFMQLCLGNSVTPEKLVKWYKEFLPEHEKEMITKPDDYYDDDFLDFLSAHEVKCVVTAENFDKVIYELAHQEMLQQPAFVRECWSTVLRTELMIKDDLETLMQSLTPKPRKVISLLKFTESLGNEETVIRGYLQKFIRESNSERLRKFLRFCTGADVITCDTITVEFVPVASMFGRSPVGHTCGCVLDIPNNYRSYQELADEFPELLRSEIWCMDFV